MMEGVASEIHEEKITIDQSLIRKEREKLHEE